jgi:hypothetical protein
MTPEAKLNLMIPEELQQALRLEAIFMPYAAKQRRTLLENKTRFVHYTSAQAALSIISSKRLWMRNATCMVDYSEVLHGFQIINSFFSDEGKKKAFSDAVDICFPGAAADAIGLFNQIWNDIRFNTYITSIAEHDNSEDTLGRLSMWRAFGGNTARVAIVFRIPAYSGAAQALHITFSPVAYLSSEQAHDVIREVITNMRENCAFLRSLSREVFVSYLVTMFFAGVTCLKHRGFHEEREWRALYSPKRFPCPLLESSTEIINGVPQTVHKLPLDAAVSELVADIDLFRMFDRLIIGPSNYPWAMYEAFVDALARAGVADAGNRVFTSDIPIRA